MKTSNQGFDREYEIAAGSRRSGMIAQLTVLLTGFALAVTSYCILNLLIQQMVDEDVHRFTADAQQTLIARLHNIEKSTQTAAAMAALSATANDSSLRDVLRDSVSDINIFDRVYFVRFNGNAGWSTLNIFNQDSGGFPQSALDSLVHTVLARRGQNVDTIVVVADPPGTQFWQENADPVIKGQPFAVASSVSKDGKDIGLIVGILRVSRLIDRSWLDQRTSLSRLTLRDRDTKKRLYFMSRDIAAGDEVDFEASGDSTQFRLGDGVWQMNILAGANRQSRFLEQTPWLMLIFGITLTVIGTLYVRNNQRQSQKLAVMNRELARKNYELNSEVAERERLNQSLRKAEREYRAIIDSVSDIIFETSVNGEIMFLNHTWEKVTGFEIEQVRGRVLFDLLHPQDQEEQRSYFEMLVKGKKGAYRTFTRLRTSEGTFRSVELALSMLRQDENRNLRVVGTFTDVEERRRAEKALSEAEKKYRTIVENAAGGIYQVTPEGQFLSANPAMARILGYESQEQILREVRNAHDHLYVSARDRAHFIRELETRGYVHNFETEVQRRDGSKIWVNENARAVKDDDGNILYYEGSLENITLRKQGEISLREAKIQSDLASRAKSEFLANMSHELRTPLNAIIGFSEIMSNQVLGPLENPQYCEYATDIHASGQRLLTIIDEILDVSRIEAGERQLNEGIVPMGALIDGCVDFLLPKAEAGNLTVKNMTKDKIPDVIGEEVAIKQIVINLVGNAIKFTPAQGRITISHEIESNGRLRLSITDTGIGMEERDIEKALSPFGQLEASHSRSASGAGLGLTLAESLIRLHGGELEIFSQKGIGTTATIVFPSRRVVRDGEADSRDPAAQQAGDELPADNGSPQDPDASRLH